MGNFRNAEGNDLREGFYTRKNIVYYVGRIEDARFVAISEQFNHAYIVPYLDSLEGYSELAQQLMPVENNDSRLRRKAVRDMRKTLVERLEAA